MRRIRNRHIPDSYFFVFPNIFTAGNLFCGFLSIVNALNGEFLLASYAILAASVFDLVDGRIARLLRKTSKFGKEFDSIADVVSFGVAPAVLVYLWALSGLSKIGWLISFLFLACGALRLARFNVMSDKLDSNSFMGLPIPMGASVVATSILFFDELNLEFYNNIIFSFLVFMLAILMVSTIKFYSFKKVVFKTKKSIFTNMFIFILVISVVAVNHKIALFMFFSLYTVSNILKHFFYFMKKKQL